jgi:murein DD-endopeptidase MepM/ murein hydrolase activator NlpD
MRNQLTITLTDVHGSRQFTLTHFIKRFIALILLVLVLLSLVGMGLLWEFLAERTNLERQILDLHRQKDSLEQEYRQALAHQSELFTELNQDKIALENEVQSKEGQLTFLQNTFGQLEAQIGLVETADSRRLSELSEIDVELMMNKIPSGMPTTFKMISDGFGWRTHPVTKNRSFHEGLDFSCDVGTPVQSTADGIVESAGWDGGYGLKVIVNHGYGFKTVYGHLSKASVKRGEVIAKGDNIGLSGNSGVSSGAHLHYEVHFMDNKLNPRPFADWSPRRAYSVFKQVKEVPWESFADLVIQEKLLVLKQSLPTAVMSSGKLN